MSFNRHCGINNPGTTCWLACCVHALASIGPFRRALHNIVVNKDRPNETPVKVLAHPFVEELQLTFHNLINKRRKDDQQQNRRIRKSESVEGIEIGELREAGELLYNTISNHPSFRPNDHEDCSEHLFYILQIIANYYSEYFQNAEQNPCTCFSIQTAENNIYHASQYYNIILPVASANFYAALREAWSPKGMNSEKGVNKTWVIGTLPDVLTFTINRAAKNNKKIISTFEVELEIAMDRHLQSREAEATAIFDSDNPEKEFNNTKNKEKWSNEIYILTAVIMHRGEKTNAGHYNIFILDINNYTGANTSDCKYVLYDDEEPAQEFPAQEALLIFAGKKKVLDLWPGVAIEEKNNYCASMLFYTKKNALMEEIKIENADKKFFWKTMKEATKTEKENGNQAENDKENISQKDRENGDPADTNDVEMEVTTVEPIRKRYTNKPVAVTRPNVNHLESPMKIQVPTVERSIVHPAIVERPAVYPIESPMVNQPPTLERAPVIPIESRMENQPPNRTTKQIQQTGNFDLRQFPNDRRRAQAQPRHGPKVTVLPRRDLQSFLGPKEPDTVQRPPLSYIQNFGTESGTEFVERMTKKINGISNSAPAEKVSRLESFLSAEDSGYDDPEEEQEEEDDKSKKAWARMTEILKVNTARMENEQPMISEVREQLRSSLLNDAGEWTYLSTANSSEDRAIAIRQYLDCSYHDYDYFYPDKKNADCNLSKKEECKKSLESLFKIKYRNVERNLAAVRKQHLSMFRQSLQKYLPSELREELIRCEDVNSGKKAMTNIIEWVFELKFSDKSGWWKNFLIFSLYFDGDLSPAPATQAIIEVLPIGQSNVREYFTDLSDHSYLTIKEYLYCRYDIFLFIIHEYAECISIWRLTFPLRDKYEVAARETENFKMESLLQCYNGMIRHLLPIFAGLNELFEKETNYQHPRILGIDKTVLTSMGAYTYALAVLRLLHASRRMVKGENVKVAKGELNMEKLGAEDVNKIVTLQLVKSVLRATINLKDLLNVWKKITGEKDIIDHTMNAMSDALKRVGNILNPTHECNLLKPLETIDPNWRETALKSAESLLTRGHGLSEKEALVKKSLDDNFKPLIETVRDCEAHSHPVKGERPGFEDEDVHLHNQRHHNKRSPEATLA